MAKLMISIADRNFQLITLEARNRGISIQELIRAVIVPIGSVQAIFEHFKERTIRYILQLRVGRRMRFSRSSVSSGLKEPNWKVVKWRSFKPPDTVSLFSTQSGRWFTDSGFWYHVAGLLAGSRSRNPSYHGYAWASISEATFALIQPLSYDHRGRVALIHLL